MFVEFKYTSIETILTIELNAEGGNYPFTKQVDTHCEMSERPRTAKLLQPGQSPVYTFARNRIWHVEGDIMTQNMGDYDAARLLLLNHILPTANPTFRFMGTITVSDENGHEYYSNVSLTSYSVPVEPLYPGVGSYMFEWESDDPFVYRLGDGRAMYI